MASSLYDTYGNLKIKQVLLDAPSGLVFHDPDDDTKTLTLQATGLGAGNANISLPTSAGALLNASSSLNGANLTAGSVATAALADDAVTADKMDIASASDIGAGMADADSLLVSDSDAGNAVKRITGTALKNYVGSLPSGTDAQILVNNTGTYASVAMSGDATISNTGAVTLANNSVSNAQVDASAAIQFSKLEALPSAQLLVGSAGNVAAAVAMSGDVTIDNTGATSLANDAVANANVAAGAAIAGTKIAPDFGAQKIETTGDAEVGAAAAFYIGDSGSDGSWRMRINGGDVVWEKRETGTWNQKGSFTA